MRELKSWSTYWLIGDKHTACRGGFKYRNQGPAGGDSIINVSSFSALKASNACPQVPNKPTTPKRKHKRIPANAPKSNQQGNTADWTPAQLVCFKQVGFVHIPQPVEVSSSNIYDIIEVRSKLRDMRELIEDPL